MGYGMPEIEAGLGACNKNSLTGLNTAVLSHKEDKNKF